MMRLRRRAPLEPIVLALAALSACCATPASAQAVRIIQHPFPAGSAPATAIITAPGGLIATGAGGGSYQRVTLGARLSISAGPSGQPAQAFTTGPDGGIWYLGAVAQGASQILVPALFEVASPTPILKFTFPAPYNQPFSPVALATGSDGALWMTDPGAGALDRYSPSEGFTVHPLPNGAAGPVQIVAGSDGSLWFSDVVTGTIGQTSTSAEIVEHAIPGAGGFGPFGLSGPYGVVAGPDGGLWFAEQNRGAIGHITTAGEVRSYPIQPPAGSVRPGDAASPRPRNLAVGPEGAIWFTDPGDNSIGTITPEGTVSEYAAAPGEVVPDAIVLAAGELWFTEDNARALGSISPSAPPVAPAPPTVASAKTANDAKRCRLGRRASRDRRRRSSHRCARRAARATPPRQACGRSRRHPPDCPARSGLPRQ